MVGRDLVHRFPERTSSIGPAYFEVHDWIVHHPSISGKKVIDGLNLHFQTRSTSSMNNEARELTRSYAAELRGQPPDEVLALRMQSSGGFSSEKPLEFEARRLRSDNPTP